MGKAKRHHKHAAPAAKGAAASVRAARHWPALTGLRGIAALGVLLLHVFVTAGGPTDLPSPLSWVSSMGWSGVDVFFTLSAFLLTLPFLDARLAGREEPSLREYWRHRAWRILPAYYVQLAIMFGLALAGFAAASTWHSPGAASLVVNAFFLYDLVPGIGPAVPPWWTLPVELGFYLLLPWFTRLLSPSRWPWLLVGILASLAWRWAILHAGLERQQEVALVEHLPGRLHQFLVGMLGAWVLVRWGSLFAAWTVLQRDLVALLSIAGFLALPALGIPITGSAYNGGPTAQPLLMSWHLFASLLVALLLIVLAAGPSRVGKLLSAGWLQALGLISYSLYLWHYPVLLALREGLGGLQAIKAEFWPFLFYALLFSLLAAAASWWMVERPAQLRARRDKIGA